MSNISQWRAQASASNYPFTDRAGMTDLSGTSRVESSDIVDVVIHSRSTLETSFWISRILVSDSEISGIVSSPANAIAATFSVDRSEASGAAVPLVDGYGTPRGLIVLGREPLFSELVPGGVDFTPTALPVLSGCVAYPVVGATRALMVGGSPVTGRVRLKEGAGIVISIDTPVDSPTVVVHAIGRQSDEDCGTGPAIKNINGVTPNEFGALFIREEDYPTPDDELDLRQILRVRPSAGGIVISLAELGNAE